jgi:steroid 5-alpha reductase family enzyme
MAKVTLVFAILLMILGLVGYFTTGSAHPTALIPTWWGLALGIGGFLAISPNERRRRLFMHINVALGALGFLGAVGAAINGYGTARSMGIDFDRVAMAYKLGMAALLFIYVNLCVRSFVEARRAREQ